MLKIISETSHKLVRTFDQICVWLLFHKTSLTPEYHLQMKGLWVWNNTTAQIHIGRMGVYLLWITIGTRYEAFS